MEIQYLKGSKIISFSPVASAGTFPAVTQVEAYWEGLRNGRTMPARSEIDPRGIADALEHAFVLDRIAPGQARIRLAGRHLNDLMDMEVRGMPITALFVPEARPRIQTCLETVFDQPATARLTLRGETGLTWPRLDAQMYFAPLRCETTGATRILGALQSKGTIGRAPRRFSVRDCVYKNLGDAPVEASRQAAGFAEPTAPFSAQIGYPHLRLVADND